MARARPGDAAERFGSVYSRLCPVVAQAFATRLSQIAFFATLPALCSNLCRIVIDGHDTMVLKRGLLQILLAALLLAAQHGALIHHTRHLQDRLPAQAQKQDQKQKSTHTGLCDFHVSFAQILGAVSCDSAPHKVASNDVELSLSHFPPAFPTDLVVPASRGPPILL